MSDDISAELEMVISATLIAVLGVAYFYTIFYMYKEYHRKRRRTFDVDDYRREKMRISLNVEKGYNTDRNGELDFNKVHMDPVLFNRPEDLKSVSDVIGSLEIGNSINHMHSENELTSKGVVGY